MSFAAPSTPPRLAKKKTSQISIPGATPKTPAKGSSELQTPRKTPFKNKTPHRSTQKATRTPRDTLAPPQACLLPTPGFTPQKLPHHRRKRPAIEDIFLLLDLLGALLPNHLVAGSGRKTVLPQKLRAPISLDLQELSKINENLAFEEDDELAPESPTRSAPRRKQPRLAQTPGKQLITDDLVEQWHGKLFHAGFLSDEETLESREPLSNPFIAGNSPKPARKVQFAQSSVNYATHNEFINLKTGERKVVELTDSQKKFQPKKLNFSGL